MSLLHLLQVRKLGILVYYITHVWGIDGLVVRLVAGSNETGTGAFRHSRRPAERGETRRRALEFLMDFIDLGAVRRSEPGARSRD